MEAPKPHVAAVADLEVRNECVIELLERMLQRAKDGELRAVAVAFERRDGFTSHEAVFSNFANRTAMVGRLNVLAQHIVLNDILEWQPSG